MSILNLLNNELTNNNKMGGNTMNKIVVNNNKEERGDVKMNNNLGAALEEVNEKKMTKIEELFAKKQAEVAKKTADKIAMQSVESEKLIADKVAADLAAKRKASAERKAARKEQRDTVRTEMETKIANIGNGVKLTQRGNEFIAMDKIAKNKMANKAAKVVSSQKKRVSPKGIVNLMNVVFDRSDKESKELKVSNILYTQTSPSQLTRGYAKVYPTVSRNTFIGNTITDSSRKVDNIQDEILLLTIKSGDDYSKHMFRIFVVDNELIYTSIDNGKLYEAISNTECDENVLKNKDIKIYEGLLYSPSQEKHETITCFKVFEGNYNDYNNDTLTTGEDKVYRILDKITNGMMSILKKKGKLTFKHAVKCNARLSQIMSPSEVLGTCSAYLFVLDGEITEFADGQGLARSKAINKWLKEKYYGNYSIPDSATSGTIKQVRPLGCKISTICADDDALELAMSKFNVIKLQRNKITAYEQEQIELAFEGKGIYAPVVYAYVEGLGIVKQEVEEVLGKQQIVYNTEISLSKELEKDLLDSFAGNGRFNVDTDRTIRLATALFIVDDMDKDVLPDFTTDLNGFKAPVDFRNAAEFAMLDESKGISGQGRLSIQMNLTALLKGQEGIDYLEKTILSNINKSYDNFMNVTDKTPKIEEFNNFYLGNVINSVAGNFVMNHDISAFQSVTNQWLKGQLSNIHNFNAIVDHSGFVRLTTDWGKLFIGENIFTINECISPDAERAYDDILKEKADAVIAAQPETDNNKITRKMLSKAKSVEDIKVTTDKITLELAKKYFEFKNNDFYVIGFRSPKMGVAEFTRLRVVFKKEREARIRSMVKDEKTAKTIIKFFNNLKPGSFMLPAYAKLQELLGGADFDFDGITLICDEEFVRLLNGVNPRVISVKKKSNEDPDKYSVGTFGDAYNLFYKQIFNNEMGIGQITNMNDLVCLLLFVDSKMVTKILRKNFKNELNKPLISYVSPLKENEDGITIISKDLVDEIVDRIRTASLTTRKEIDTIIYDLNDVLRFYQESTIDASKSGDKIKVLFNLLNDCSLLCLKDKATISIDWNTKTVLQDVKRFNTGSYIPKTGLKAGIEQITINDVFHQIMVKAYDLLIEKANLFIDHVSNMSLATEHLDFLTSVSNKYPQYIESLITINKRYNEANANRIAKVKALQDEKSKISKTLRKICIPDISKEYNDVIDALTKQTRYLLKDLSDVERAALLKAVAIRTKDGSLDANGGNSICHTILPEEYLLLVLAIDKNANRFARSKVYGANRYNEGDIVTIKDGISQEENTNIPSFIGDKNLEGTFMIEKDSDGATYLVEDIESLINIEMPEKKTVVVRLFPSKGGSYTKLLARLQEEKPKAIKLSAYKGGDTSDLVSIITDGIKKPLCKYQAPSGKSPLGDMLNGFVGNVTAINYNKKAFINEDGVKNSYYNILVVAEEAEVEFKSVSPLDRFKNASITNKEVAVDNTASSKPSSAKDLLAALRANKTTTVTKDNSNRFAPTSIDDSICADFGGYEDADVTNFLKSLRK